MAVRFAQNPFRVENPVYGSAQCTAYDPRGAAEARALLRTWPDHAPTPLRECPTLAVELGLARLFVKDEGLRAPLHSFKSMGGAFALGELLRAHIARDSGARPDYAALIAGKHRAAAADFCAVSATDGNHGRSLAWGARMFGTRSRIYLPANVSQSRSDAIAAFGAEIVRIDDNYDAAVAQAKEDAEAHGWSFVQDTSFGEYTETHRLIMHGYSLMVEEIVEQLGDVRPTHVFLQVGCGGMAATIIAYLWDRWGSDLPRLILVQSEKADAAVRSFEAREHVAVDGDHDTLMIGIACGEIAELAWPLFEPVAFGALAISDKSAVRAMRMAADEARCTPPILMGETGAAGLGALLTADDDLELKAAMGLDENSIVLLINSEGETDPDRYTALVGKSVADVRGRG